MGGETLRERAKSRVRGSTRLVSEPWPGFVHGLKVLVWVSRHRNACSLSRRLAESPGTFFPFDARRRFRLSRHERTLLVTFCHLSARDNAV